jgi:hypothetical protein
MLPNNHDKYTPIGEIKERPSPAKRGIARWEARYLKAVDCLQKDLRLTLKSTWNGLYRFTDRPYDGAVILRGSKEKSIDGYFDRIRRKRILYAIFTCINLKQGAAALFSC